MIRLEWDYACGVHPRRTAARKEVSRTIHFYSRKISLFVGLSNMLDKELDWRKPGERSHR